MKISKHLLFATALVGISLHGLSARADDLKVYSPKIEKGEFAAEANLNYDVDNAKKKNNYFSQVLGFEYGFTDYYKTELAAEIEKDNGASDQVTNIKWENIISPWKPGENPVDVGFYIEGEKATKSGEPDNIETKLLLEKDIGKMSNLANFMVGHEVGSHAASGFNTGLALASSYRMNQKFEPGIEYYADFGNTNDSLSFNEQGHKIGPIAKGKLGKVRYETGALFGVSDAAPDTTLKLNLEYEF